MLPTSKDYLTRAGFPPRTAAYMLIGLFLAGVFAIRIVSGFIHRHIPSHVVDCAHTHHQDPDPESGQGLGQDDNNEDTEHTPLLSRTEPRSSKSTPAVIQKTRPEDQLVDGHQQRRESLRLRLSRRISLLMGNVKTACDDNGPCYGFSQTCGQECSKVLPKTEPTLDNASHSPPSDSHQQGHSGSDSEHVPPRRSVGENLLHDEPERSEYFDAASTRPRSSRQDSGPTREPLHKHHSHQHHHHVPQNAFLSIGLQTSLAIALHKLPEGFITYATNHASPNLGMTVFLALFIHNITEGFAMALPLYLALHSRFKAILWSSLLGGISQPAGAGLAALWIWGSHRADGNGHSTTGPSWGVYGGMFAATAGIMTSVALQLFSEGSELTHHRSLCIGCAIGGMGLMGLSFALTA